MRLVTVRLEAARLRRVVAAFMPGSTLPCGTDFIQPLQTQRLPGYADFLQMHQQRLGHAFRQVQNRVFIVDIDATDVFAVELGLVGGVHIDRSERCRRKQHGDDGEQFFQHGGVPG